MKNVLAARKSCPAFRFDREFAHFLFATPYNVSFFFSFAHHYVFYPDDGNDGRRQCVWATLPSGVWGEEGVGHDRSGGAFAGF